MPTCSSAEGFQTEKQAEESAVSFFQVASDVCPPVGFYMILVAAVSATFFGPNAQRSQPSATAGVKSVVSDEFPGPNA